MLLVALASGLQLDSDPKISKSLAARYAGPTLSKDVHLWWLHVPKVGSSFANSVFGCTIQMPKSVSNRTYPTSTLTANTWMYHRVLGQEMPDDELKTVVTMVRKGPQRLASAFKEMQLDGKVWGVGNGIGWGFPSQKSLDDTCKKAQHGKTPGNDVSLRNFTGCQTNMIVGRGCMSGAVHDPHDMAKAKKRLALFWFVGLQDQWALSICLFNYKATGERFVEPEQLSVARSNSKGSEYDTTGYPDDDPDISLYSAAKRRFNAEIIQNRITKENCAHTRKGEPLWENDDDQSMLENEDDVTN